MFAKFKRLLYFPVAYYFRFFAAIKLRRWSPRIIVVTGSNGKTTLLHMLEAQIGEMAKYSHNANSSFGIPFDILDLHRNSLLKSEWISLILKTPFNAFKKVPSEKLYVVEADCDRPGEGKFLASLLKPEVVIWVSISKTHAMYFDKLVVDQKFEKVEEAIAYEFGYFMENCRHLAIIDGDSELMKNQLDRTNVKVIQVKKDEQLEKYTVSKEGSKFQIEKKEYVYKSLLPEEVFYSIVMCKKVTEYLGISFDSTFKNFILPSGRGSIFEGVKNTTIIDSSYNLSPGSVLAILSMYNQISTDKKWLVLGDMIDIGLSTQREHEKFADWIHDYNFEKIILMGPRVGKYTYPKLQRLHSDKNKLVKFLGPKETLNYIRENITGGETILFKGARFMEGIIENLLKNKTDVSKLPRREKIWEIRRKQWGL